MPIGLVSDEDLQREVDSYSRVRVPSTSPKTAQIEVIERPGRKDGDVNVPESLRKIIGETSVIDGRQSALSLAEQFGISPSSVSAYAKGATSTASYASPSPSIKEHINKSRTRAMKRAGKVLTSALAAITQDKLDYTDARDLSGIAKDMSVIIKNLEPPTPPSSDQSGGAASPQFVIFAPTFRDERSFESIVVNE